MQAKSPESVRVFILGTTASGKTRLSLDIGEHFDFSIVNTDVYSFYKGCSIMTAKADLDEQKRVQHHCIDFLEMDDNSFNIHKFSEKANPKVSELLSKDRGAVIVGGSNYYNEQLIFEKDCDTLFNDHEKRVAKIMQFLQKGRLEYAKVIM